MKFVVCVGDGMADLPVDALAGRTPLEAARTPAMDALALQGTIGLVRTVPGGMPAGTEVAMLSVYGYDPQEHFKGRGPWEAAAMGVALEPKDVAFRCNLVTLKGGVMQDYSAGHITSEEAKALIQMLDKKLGGKDLRFYPGVGYRHLMVWRGGADKVTTAPPHNIMGEPVASHWPKGRGESRLRQLMEDASLLLEGHEVNRARRGEGKPPANAVWVWGAGFLPAIQSYPARFGLSGGVISAVDIVKGMGLLAGLDIVSVPGITGYYDTNYEGKAQYAVKTLHKKDYCLVHLEAPDEASHNGHLEEKVLSIERFDQLILAPIHRALEDAGEPYRLLVLPDHITEVVGRRHNPQPVPFLLAGDGVPASGAPAYHERAAQQSGVRLENGVALIESFVRGSPLHGGAG